MIPTMSLSHHPSTLNSSNLIVSYSQRLIYHLLTRSASTYSTQGRYQPRATERITVRGNHVLQPTSHDMTRSDSPSHVPFHFATELNFTRCTEYPSLRLSPPPHLSLYLRRCSHHALRWPPGHTMIESRDPLHSIGCNPTCLVNF